MTRRWSARPEILRFCAGILLVGSILYGQRVYGDVTSSGRTDPALIEATQGANPRPVDVVVVVDFPPERFHQERLSTYGVFAGRDGAPNRIRLRQVSPDKLAALAKVAWVSRIEPRR